MGWVTAAWKELTTGTIKHCFGKYSFPSNCYQSSSPDCYEELHLLSNEILVSCSTVNYVNADNSIATYEKIDIIRVDLRETSRLTISMSRKSDER